MRPSRWAAALKCVSTRPSCCAFARTPTPTPMPVKQIWPPPLALPADRVLTCTNFAPRSTKWPADSPPTAHCRNDSAICRSPRHPHRSANDALLGQHGNRETSGNRSAHTHHPLVDDRLLYTLDRRRCAGSNSKSFHINVSTASETKTAPGGERPEIPVATLAANPEKSAWAASRYTRPQCTPTRTLTPKPNRRCR